GFTRTIGRTNPSKPRSRPLPPPAHSRRLSTTRACPRKSWRLRPRNPPPSRVRTCLNRPRLQHPRPFRLPPPPAPRASNRNLQLPGTSHIPRPLLLPLLPPRLIHQSPLRPLPPRPATASIWGRSATARVPRMNLAVTGHKLLLPTERSPESGLPAAIRA